VGVTVDFATDSAWAKTVLPQQQEIIAPILGRWQMRIADFTIDTQAAGDLSVLRSEGFNIGLRARRPGFAIRYPLTEFTFRSLRTNGIETELAKIGRGLSSWFGYFHADKDGNLPHWCIIDLNSFRRYAPALRLSGREMRNIDGKTFFRVFDLRHFAVGILIAASGSVLDVLPPLFGFAASRRQKGEWQPWHE
jgi:hypothetical protein